MSGCCLLCCSVVGVWVVVICVLSVMRVVVGIPLWVVCVFVSVVHPVAILSAVFCVICRLMMFVSDASGDHMVETYSSMGLVMALYVAMIVSFFSHVVDVGVLSICIVLRVFVAVIYMCLLYVSLRSRVSPSSFGLMLMGSMMLSICSSSCVLYSTGSGVKRVHVVLSGLRMRLFVRVHVCISCRYDWMFALAMFMLLCVDVVCVGRQIYWCMWCWSGICVYVEECG